MRSLLLLTFLPLLVFCTPLSDRLNTWNNAPADELVRSWGPPSQVVRLDNGRRLFVYGQSRTLFVPSPSLGPGSQSMYFLPQFSCRYQFEVDSQNQIVGWQYQGACR